MPLERFSAAWREAYIQEATVRERSGNSGPCVFCELASMEPGPDSGVVAHSELSYVCLNAYPYGSGHLLALPRRHVAGLGELTDDEYFDLFAMVREATRSVEVAYGPDGLNIGANLGRASGAGIPGHLHVHVLPRWNGDTNFMASIAETRVLPESLATTWEKVSDAWGRSRSS